MLARYINIFHISGFLRLSMRVEPRWPKVFIVVLQRIMPENISLQKPDWKFEGLISFRWRDIQKNKLLTMYYPNMNFFEKDSSCRRKQMSGGSDFLLDCRDHTSKIFWSKNSKFEGVGTLRYGDISILKMYFLLALIEKISEFSNNFYYRDSISLIFFIYSDTTYRALCDFPFDKSSNRGGW